MSVLAQELNESFFLTAPTMSLWRVGVEEDSDDCQRCGFRKIEWVLEMAVAEDEVNDAGERGIVGPLRLALCGVCTMGLVVRAHDQDNRPTL